VSTLRDMPPGRQAGEYVYRGRLILESRWWHFRGGKSWRAGRQALVVDAAWWRNRKMWQRPVFTRHSERLTNGELAAFSHGPCPWVACLRRRRDRRWADFRAGSDADARLDVRNRSGSRRPPTRAWISNRFGGSDLGWPQLHQLERSSRSRSVLPASAACSWMRNWLRGGASAGWRPLHRRRTAFKVGGAWIFQLARTEWISHGRSWTFRREALLHPGNSARWCDSSSVSMSRRGSQPLRPFHGAMETGEAVAIPSLN